MPGVHGLDLLAYRFEGDVPRLIREVCAAVDKPVVVAGSIDRQERLQAVIAGKAAGFTIGTAALDGVFPARSKALPDQLTAIQGLLSHAGSVADQKRNSFSSDAQPDAAKPSMPMPDAATDTYERLIALLDEHKATYRLIDHPPEGRTDLVSPMRGHDAKDAAKCMIVMVKIGKKLTRFVLAVVPGDKRVNIKAVQSLYNGTFARFAETSVAERLSGSVSGTILPFSFTSDLQVVVDPGLLQSGTIYFNAARLDRSIALRAKDYEAIAQPRLAAIASN
jgi:Ala-tRNA(Pro) deacylase